MTVSAADSQKQRGQTAYHVFEEFSEEGGALSYRPFATNVPANNAEHAVKTVATKRPADLKSGVRLVAVPAARWKPQIVTVSQTTTVKVGDQT